MARSLSLCSQPSPSLPRSYDESVPAACPPQRLVNYSLLGIPKDYLFQYQRGIERVTRADILAAARRHLHPAAQTACVVGDAARIRPQLEALGTWTVQELRLEGSGGRDGAE